MANKTKDKSTIFNYDIEVTDNKKKKKTKNSPAKKEQKQKKRKDKKNNKNKEKYNLDNEIVIGMKPVDSPKKQNRSKKEKKDTKESKKNYTSKKGTNKKTKESKSRKGQAKGKTKKKVVKSERQIKSKKIALKIVKWSVLVVGLLTAIILFMLSPLFNINQIQVEYNNKISKEQIISLSKIEINQNTWKLNKKSIKESIKQNAYIENVEIRRILPSIVVLEIQERVPTFLLEFANGFVYINNQGYMLEINEEKLDLPIITGIKTKTDQVIVGNRLIVEDLEKLETVLKIMENAKSIEIADLITSIDITSKQEYKLLLESEKKMVFLGDASTLETKMLYVKQILEREKDNQGIIYANIDLSKRHVYFSAQSIFDM